MKKILFGIFILSSLSFATQVHNNLDHAKVPINVTVDVSNPEEAQLRILDSLGEYASSLNIEHFATTNMKDGDSTDAFLDFSVVRGAASSTLIGEGTLAFTLTKDNTRGVLWENTLKIKSPTIKTANNTTAVSNTIYSSVSPIRDLTSNDKALYALETVHLTVEYTKLPPSGF